VLVSFGLALALWIAASGVVQLMDRLKNVSTGAGVRQRLASTPRAYWGMLVAHLGVAAFVVGITMVKGYDQEKDVRMQAGDTVEVNGYVFTLRDVRTVQGPNYVAAQASLDVTRNGKLVTVMNPEKRVYRVQQMPMTEAAIEPGLTGDLYVSMGDQIDERTWVVKVQHKPFIDWIWGGCLLMALGGVLAACDRRYRVPATRTRAEETRAAKAAPA